MKHIPEGIKLQRIDEAREFFESALSPKLILKNMIISGRDNPNLRLWAIREKLGLSIDKFAKICNIDIAEYKKYEFQGNKIPNKIINKISRKFHISKNWLLNVKFHFFPFLIE